jgi:hypothetical protein
LQFSLWIESCLCFRSKLRTNNAHDIVYYVKNCASIQCNFDIDGACRILKSNSGWIPYLWHITLLLTVYAFYIFSVCRVSCMVACDEDICASAIVCLGYPLKVAIL